jgi:hypothetical protein
VADGFLNSKRDKRTIKHSSFVNKIQKKATDARPSKLKRRRPNKKLVATLNSLGDALEDVVEEIREEDKEGMDAEQKKMGRVRHKSLKTRPGALKRKEKVVKEEMERFGKSLALLSGMKEGEQGQGQAVETDAADGAAEAPKQSTSSRFAALRTFISSTMEQNPAFLQRS